MSDWRIEGVRVERPGFVLGPVSLELRPGEALAVLGPNGSGKSTLLRAIAGLEPVRAGRIERDGSDLTGRPPEDRGIGYIPPGGALLPHRTVLGNVAYPSELRGLADPKGRARQLLERLGLGRFAGRYPRSLSTGEQQRVAVARALATEPRLLLWDEPVAALDLPTRHGLHELLRGLRERDRIPLLFVTHDPEDAFGIGDRFLRLEGGRPIRAGPLARFGEPPRSAFDARFLGYPNVLSPATLRDASGPMVGWLAERSGPGGLAFSARAVTVRPGGAHAGTARRVEPRADRWLVRLVADGLELLGEAPADPPGGPPSGSPIAFDISEEALWPLDNWSEPGE